MTLRYWLAMLFLSIPLVRDTRWAAVYAMRTRFMIELGEDWQS